ncbi:exodeoxyribonuclease VII large subunit [bacterium]|nr:exodeoxyribonuclease VII large subunit [bacterium]RQV96356.1 MAG: exodeoxyribonuclease VII large subunit [bacterium]
MKDDPTYPRNEGHEVCPSTDKIYTVSEITREIKLTLEDTFPPIWIEGEVSNFKRHTSGHLYFSLKDQESQISCVMWRGRNQNLLFQPEDGMKVRVWGNVTVYERQGRYQLDVILIRSAGRGELQLAFEAMKKRLEAEGLFRSEFKKRLPPFPERIGIITSPTGAVIQDIISVTRRRFPSVQLILRPVRVQGEGAAEEIAEAIKDFNAYQQVDVLIVGRGGGSLEDLWAFNEEIVARAIFDSTIPIVSSVGHETDFSIADFVADVRAPTPSAAAELVVRDREELLQTMSHWNYTLNRALEDRIVLNREKIEMIKRSYGFRWPIDRIREYRQRLDEVSKNQETIFLHQMDRLKSDIIRLKSKLQALCPQEVLQRGYSITTRISDNRVIKTSSEVSEKENIRIRFAKGTIRSMVEVIEE